MAMAGLEVGKLQTWGFEAAVFDGFYGSMNGLYFYGTCG